MEKPGGNLWTIDQLAEKAAHALAVDYAGQANGQVRAVPDLRTIRYYTTLGLLDRPAAMRGRTGLYARRHLLQLVAIKRLQAQGKSLAQLQSELVGLSDSELNRIANLAIESVDSTHLPAGPRRDFWTQMPAPVLPQQPSGESPSFRLQGVPLNDNVTLMLASHQHLDAEAIETIRTAAAPLLELLKQRQIC